MRNIRSIFLGALALLAPTLLPATAEAGGLDACGDIFVAGEAECTLYVDEICTAKCEPLSFTAACAAELRADCEGDCSASASVECTGSCEADCQASCEVKPAEFNCVGACQADCSADCQGRCSADSNSAECQASCKATCSASCDASCEVTPAEADCEAKCQASCSGSCEAQANVDCQIECQASGFAECEADLQGGCEAQCQRPDGALFCDGQFVDAANLDACIAALQALFAIRVEVYADGSAECNGNTCYAEGEVGCSCDAGGPGDLPLAAALGLLGLGALRRRRPRA